MVRKNETKNSTVNCKNNIIAMKKNVILAAACLLFPLAAKAATQSQLLDEITNNMGKLFPRWEEGFQISGLTHITFLILLAATVISLGYCIAGIISSMKYRKEGFLALLNRILPQTTAFVFLAGTAIYFVGFAHSGTAGNFITIILRSVLASFEMFLSKSSLIGVAENCRCNSTYMFLFALFHFLAVAISMLFAVACFGKRILDWFRKKWWSLYPKKKTLNVFWGVNDKSINLAKDIFLQTKGKERIVFVDMPDEDGNKNGRSFSGIMGLLSYKTGFARQMTEIKYVLMKSDTRPSTLEDCKTNFLNSMGLTELGRIMSRSDKVNFFIFTDNSDANLRAALNILESDIANKTNNIYCSARRNKATSIHEECYDGRLHIIDDSRESVMTLAMQKDNEGKFIAHPVNFVSIDNKLGYVKEDKPFTAMIIGFNTTGQDAMKFLYEYSAFPGADGKKVPVQIMAFDANLEATRGELYQEIPALPELEKTGEISLYAYNSGTVKFYHKLQSVINQLNYVVIATGDDDRNLQTASAIFEYAYQHRKDGTKKFRIFVRLYNPGNEFKFRKTIEKYKDNCNAEIYYFGSPRSIYTKSWIVDKEESEYAEKFHESYCKANNESHKSKEERRKKQIDKEGSKLLGNRGFNRTVLQDISNYKHCYTKEILMGLCAKDGSITIPAWPLKTNGPDDNKKAWHTKLLNASKCEHMRWNASHLMMGYTAMPEEDIKPNMKSCNERTKRHMCLVEWDKLKKLPSKTDYQMYDYFVVKTTLKIYAQRNNMTINYEE